MENDVEVGKIELSQTQSQSQSDDSAVLDALKELTKQLAENTKELQKLRADWEIHRKAGKF